MNFGFILLVYETDFISLSCLFHTLAFSYITNKKGLIKHMNISDIAKLAGVSPASVSRYLNNGYLSEEKKEKIKAVIEETGYKPSTQAQTLRTGKSKLIGVIIPKIDSSSISQVVLGISSVLSENGYQILLANTFNNERKELDYIQTFNENFVDGIINLGTVSTREHAKAFKNMTVPAVVLGQNVSYASCIYHDDYNASLDLTKHVLSKGHKNIAYIGVTDKDKAVGVLRKNGFIDATSAASGVKTYVASGDFTMNNGYHNTAKLLKDHPDIDAIVCATDTIALGVVQYLNKHGLDIPGKIAVAGFGNSSGGQILTHPLTTIKFFYKECGIEGAKMLLEKLQSPETPCKSLMLGYEINEGASV